MINKKGQVGKIITILPILFLVFIVMGLFVLACSAYSLAKGGDAVSSTFAERVVMQDDLMLKTIKINYGGKEQELRVVDAIALCLSSKSKCVRGDDLHGSLVSAGAFLGLTSSDKLLFVSIHEQENVLPYYVTFYIVGQGDCSGKSCGADVTAPYPMKTISFMTATGKEYVSYYLGGSKS